MSIFGATKPNLSVVSDPATRVVLTRDTLEKIFADVEMDPLAGIGHLSKREIVIDRIIAHCNNFARPKFAEPQPIVAETAIELTKEVAA
jgi:hypothetical protein